MSKTAFIFPGQGSQYVGMGRDISEAFPAARDAFDVANDILGFDLSAICFNGPEERLRETRYTQLAILAHSVAVWRVIKDKGTSPDFVAGHSVGEYSALVANGSLAYSDALRLVRVRAEAMYSSGVKWPGAMAAIIGIPEGKLDDLLTEAGEAGIIVPANYNSPAQIVVSGEVAAVEKAIEVARSHGAKRAIRLNVSGAFHSPLMEPAEQELASAMDAVGFSDTEIPVVSNVSARGVTAPGEIAELLRRQLTSPVRWHQSMTYLLGRGIRSFVEVGPGKVLCGLLKRIDPEAGCTSCSDRESIEGFVEGVVT
jgi:[acyl-carrier-protein] S-malonyltransferase